MASRVPAADTIRRAPSVGLVGRATVRRVLIAAVLVVVLLVFLFPYAYMVSTSFKTPGQTLAVPPTLLPKTWSIQSYLRLGQGSGIARAFANSIAIAVLSTLLALLLGVPAAYAITRYGTAPGRVFLVFALVTRMVPAVTLGIPLFTIMSTPGTPLDVTLAEALQRRAASSNAPQHIRRQHPFPGRRAQI